MKASQKVKLDEMAKLIEEKKKVIKEKEDYLFSDAALKLKTKDYDELYGDLLKEKNSLAKLRKKRDTIYKQYHDFVEIEGVSTIPASTLCI